MFGFGDKEDGLEFYTRGNLEPVLNFSHNLRYRDPGEAIYGR